MTHIDEIGQIIEQDGKRDRQTLSPKKSLTEQRDDATARIFQEYTEKFGELQPKVELSYTKEEGTGNYTIHLSRNGKTESIKVPESGDGFKFASVADMLQILYAGIESKGAIFVNKRTDLFTQGARALLWNDEQYKTLPFDIIINSGSAFSARKEENAFKHSLGRRMEEISRNI